MRNSISIGAIYLFYLFYLIHPVAFDPNGNQSVRIEGGTTTTMTQLTSLYFMFIFDFDSGGGVGGASERKKKEKRKGWMDAWRLEISTVKNFHHVIDFPAKFRGDLAGREKDCSKGGNPGS